MLAELLLGAVAFSWAAGFVLMKTAVSHHSVWVVLWLRFGLAALLIVPLCMRLGGWRWSALRTGSLLGVLLFGSFGLLISGLQKTTATNTGILTGLCVVWVPILGWVLLRKKMRFEALMGVALCFVGVAVMSEGTVGSLGLGDLLVVCGSLFAALHILGVDRWSGGHDAATLTLVQVAVVAVMSCLVSFWEGSVWPAVVDANLVLALCVTACASTAFAFWVQTKYQRETTPTRAAMIFNLEPIFSALLAFSLLGERLGLNVVVACGLIVAGMCATEMRFKSAKP